MEAELRKAAEQIVDRATVDLASPTYSREITNELERRRWRRMILRLLEEGVIEIGPNLNTGPDAEAMADEIIKLCGGDAARAERVVTRTRRFA